MEQRMATTLAAKEAAELNGAETRGVGDCIGDCNGGQAAGQRRRQLKVHAEIGLVLCAVGEPYARQPLHGNLGTVVATIDAPDDDQCTDIGQARAIGVFVVGVALRHTNELLFVFRLGKRGVQRRR